MHRRARAGRPGDASGSHRAALILDCDPSIWFLARGPADVRPDRIGRASAARWPTGGDRARRSRLNYRHGHDEPLQRQHPLRADLGDAVMRCGVTWAWAGRASRGRQTSRSRSRRLDRDRPGPGTGPPRGRTPPTVTRTIGHGHGHGEGTVTVRVGSESFMSRPPAHGGRRAAAEPAVAAAASEAPAASAAVEPRRREQRRPPHLGVPGSGGGFACPADSDRGRSPT